jgi:CubicO group peptidase (beta-lactamase class C family)
VTESIRPRIATGDGLQYGYQWWVGTVEWRSRPLSWAAAFGNGGQRLFLVPELDLAVVTTAGAYNQREIGAALASLLQAIVAAATDPPPSVTPRLTSAYER